MKAVCLVFAFALALSSPHWTISAEADEPTCSGQGTSLGFDPVSGTVTTTVCNPGSTASSVPTSVPGASPDPTEVVYEDVRACSTGRGVVPCNDQGKCIAPAVLDNVLSKTPPSREFLVTGQQECVGGPNGPVPPIPGDDELIAAAAQEAKKAFPFDVPSPATNPAPTTLVNIPTILTAGADQHTLRDNATLLGVDVTLTATPSFDWTLPDLPDIVTSDPGLPYDGHDPAKNPGYYVTATWTTVGTRKVQVSVTWTVTLIRHDTKETLTATDPVTKANQIVIEVKQARSELTGNS